MSIRQLPSPARRAAIVAIIVLVVAVLAVTAVVSQGRSANNRRASLVSSMLLPTSSTTQFPQRPDSDDALTQARWVRDKARATANEDSRLSVARVAFSAQVATNPLMAGDPWNKLITSYRESFNLDQKRDLIRVQLIDSISRRLDAGNLDSSDPQTLRWLGLLGAVNHPEHYSTYRQQARPELPVSSMRPPEKTSPEVTRNVLDELAELDDRAEKLEARAAADAERLLPG
ncbi:MAG: hypothetical protein H7123_00250 [Thermoleophilia bacterium]|nr:hypothetical protein [Thermoleophilia bacterium]